MEDMKILSDFFLAAKDDPRIGVTHIGIYASLFQYWCTSNRPVPLKAYCHEIKPIAKVSANATYYRCVRDLGELGYLTYLPSLKRNEPSRFYFLTGNRSDNGKCDNGK